jgi:hypothetical protein
VHFVNATPRPGPALTLRTVRVRFVNIGDGERALLTLRTLSAAPTQPKVAT